MGVALFSFSDWDSYERYRNEAGVYEECRRATTIATDQKCFTSYERNFITPVV